MADHAASPNGVSAVDRRANIVGTGLIGGSIGLALRARGWRVHGSDADPERAARAAELDAIDAIGVDREATVTFVAAPVGAVPAVAREMLGSTPGVVTDVGSVKAPVVEAIGDSRFVGGHPMAGSEQDGVDGARGDLFNGAVWVLTPVDGTDDEAYALVGSIATSLGAEVVTMPPERHDQLVAVVSHVPHLTAATLMGLAAGRSAEHRTLLRLAAGGFRDMTRIAAGHPGIWPDICVENRTAIVEVLDEFIASLSTVREVVADRDRERLLDVLERARVSRRNLPTTAGRPDELTEIRVPVPDRQGVIAGIATMANDLGVTIYDLEIAHSAEGPQGVLVMIVDRRLAERLAGGLMATGYRPSLQALE